MMKITQTFKTFHPDFLRFMQTRALVSVLIYIATDVCANEEVTSKASKLFDNAIQGVTRMEILGIGHQEIWEYLHKIQRELPDKLTKQHIAALEMVGEVVQAIDKHRANDWP